MMNIEDVRTVPIGPYSAYAIAVKYGYKGTEEEWIREVEANRIRSEEAAAKAEQATLEALQKAYEAGTFKGDKGDKGDTGPQGEQGIQGEKGETGDTGPQGVQGETGPQGPQGEKGDKGDIGETGPQGPQGEKGEKGDTGDIGPTGPQGEKGDKGDTGEKGEKGDTGDTGPQGPQGEKGDTGPQGPKGEIGPPVDLSGVQKLIDESLAAQREEDYAKIKFWVSPDPTSPAELFGGTWERIQNRMIMGASDSYPVGTTGGSATHTQSVAEMPGHTHTGSTGEAGWHGHSASTNSTGGHTHGAWTGGAGGHSHTVSAATSTGKYVALASADWASQGAGATVNAGSPTTSWVGDHSHGVGMNSAGDHSHTVSVSGNGTHTHTVSIGSTGSGQAMDILNPYLALYMWRRVEE